MLNPELHMSDDECYELRPAMHFFEQTAEGPMRLGSRASACPALQRTEMEIDASVSGIRGADLGWLIYADERTAHIYRAGRSEPQRRAGIARLAVEGPVAGFESDLTDIWAGL